MLTDILETIQTQGGSLLMSSDDVKPLTVAKLKISELPASPKKVAALDGSSVVPGGMTSRSVLEDYGFGHHIDSRGVHVGFPRDPQRFRSTLLPRGSSGSSDTRSDEGETIVPSPPTINIPQPSRTLRDQEESFYHLTPQEKFDYEQELRAGIAKMAARNKSLEIIIPPPGTPLSSIKHTFDIWHPIVKDESSLSVGRLVLRGIFMLIDHLLKVYKIDIPDFLQIQMKSIDDYDPIIYALADQFNVENGVAFSPMTKLFILLAINVFAVVGPRFLAPSMDPRQAMNVADFVKKQLDIVPDKRQLPSPPALGRPTVPGVGGGIMGDLMNLVPKDPETVKKALTAIASIMGTQ